MVTSNTSLLGLSVVMAAGLCIPALADDLGRNYYARIFGGGTSLSDTSLSGPASGTTGFDTGQVLGAAIGYDFAENPFRTELEFAYRRSDADGGAGVTGDFASTTLALNGYYDFDPIAGGRLRPYVGAGLAYVTEIDFDITGGLAAGEYSDTGVFGYQLMAGAEYPITETWSLNGEIRYLDAGGQTLTGPTGTLAVDYDSVELIFGTTFRF